MDADEADDLVDNALLRLREAADAVRSCWPASTWRRVSGPGPESVLLDRGVFQGLLLEPGARLVLETDLEPPTTLLGWPVGEEVEATVNSLYPCGLSWNDQTVLDGLGEQEVLAAPSPALVSGVGAGRLELTIDPPAHQLMPWWVQVTFTTVALRERFEVLDVAWSRLALAQAAGRGGRGAGPLIAAAQQVPDRPLALGGDELRARMELLALALEPLAPAAAETTVHLVGHAHIDLCWLWTWSDAQRTILRDFRTIVALMEDFPELTFTHSQPVTYDVVRRQDPALFDRVRSLVEEGRWEAASVTWVEGDNVLVAGEALIRQIERGVGWTRRHLAVDPAVYMAPDNFGHSANMPQLALEAGASAYFHMRANPGRADMWPAYWWEGADGSRILALSTPKYTGEITAGDLARAALRASRNGHSVALHLHGLGDHGGGPTRLNLEALRRFHHMPGLPKATCSTLGSFAAALLRTDPALPVHRGESETIFEGCYSSQRQTKERNRRGENLLLTAEALAAMAGECPDLDEAWSVVLFNQFHDILDGSSIAEVHAEQADAFDAVEKLAHDAIDSALNAIVGSPDPNGTAVAVVNVLGSARREVVEVEMDPPPFPIRLVSSRGHLTIGQPTVRGVCFLAEAAPFSVEMYRLDGPWTDEIGGSLSVEAAHDPGGPQRAVLDAPEVSDPPYLRVQTAELDAYVRRDSGIIASLRDLRTGRQLVGFGLRRQTDYLNAARHDLALNVLQLVEERPHGMSAWQLGEVWRETTLLGTAESRIVEMGPVRATLEARHRIGASEIVQRLRFYAESPRIDVDTSVKWFEPSGPATGVPSLKVGFTVAADRSEAWFETPFAAVRRRADGQEVPALRWAWAGDVDGGIAVVNDSTAGHDALGSRLRLTLVRSSYSPDANADQGQHEIRYGIIPTVGTWRDGNVTSEAAAFNHPLLVRPCQPCQPRLASVPRIEGKGVGISSLRRTEAGWTIRLYDTTAEGCTATVTSTSNERFAVVRGFGSVRPEEPRSRLVIPLGPSAVATVISV